MLIHLKKMMNYVRLHAQFPVCFLSSDFNFALACQNAVLKRISWRKSFERLPDQVMETVHSTENMNSTPGKRTKNGSRKLCSTQMPFDLTLDEQQLLTIPNLRLDAKLTAEENSRVFAGKQVHPFFTSWKSGKNNQELTGSDSKWTFFEKKEKCIIFNHPIDVFENVEEDHMMLDWGHWKFRETSVSDTLDYQCSPVYEGLVELLNFDNYLSGSHFTRTSLHPNSQQSSIQLKIAPKLSAELYSTERGFNVVT